MRETAIGSRRACLPLRGRAEAASAASASAAAAPLLADATGRHRVGLDSSSDGSSSVMPRSRCGSSSGRCSSCARASPGTLAALAAALRIVAKHCGDHHTLKRVGGAHHAPHFAGRAAEDRGRRALGDAQRASSSSASARRGRFGATALDGLTRLTSALVDDYRAVVMRSSERAHPPRPRPPPVAAPTRGGPRAESTGGGRRSVMRARCSCSSLRCRPRCWPRPRLTAPRARAFPPCPPHRRCACARASPIKRLSPRDGRRLAENDRTRGLRAQRSRGNELLPAAKAPKRRQTCSAC